MNVNVPGAVIYLLDLFCNSKIPETRETAVELLARMMSDKLHGPKVNLTWLQIKTEMLFCTKSNSNTKIMDDYYFT